MVTFFVAIILLFVGYSVYSRITEKVFGADGRNTPAIASPDGVDKVPVGKWKAFLIELLNIAGTGPIFGAISGALFGPIVFLWIVFGSILGGAVHDYMTGMMSTRNGGCSVAELAGIYGGKVIKWIIRIFTIILLILVTSVFVVSPSSLLEELTSGNVKSIIWVVIILGYFFVATIFPIDKIIGRVYPLFAIILLGMAISIIVGVFVTYGDSPILNLIDNIKDYSAANGGLPWWPFMLTTVACGAVSGFHATQSPIVAKCIKSEKDGRIVFYYAMIVEGIIAIIWAAAAMVFYRVDTPDGWTLLNQTSGSHAVYEISKTILGPVGGVLAIVGVIVCPITSGDTAFRGLRLIVAEIFHFDQKPIKNRLIITIPTFAIIIGIALWNFMDPTNFNVLWRWFAWSNQVLATVSLWIATIYLIKLGKYRWGSLLTCLPAVIMTAVCITYLFGEPNIGLGKVVPYLAAVIIGASCAALLLIAYFINRFLFYKHKKKLVENVE